MVARVLQRPLAVSPWMDHAECRHHDPDLWFTDERVSRVAEIAVTICETQCRVQMECLRHAVDLRLTGRAVNGIWGGRYMSGMRAHEAHKLHARLGSM